MHRLKRLLFAVLLALVIGSLAVSAQSETSGTLVLGQPLPSQIEAGATLSYDYTLAQPSQVTIQALGDSVQPSISILRGGTVVAAQLNPDGALTTSLTALLDPGSYVVQVGAANSAAGLVVVVLQSEIPVSSTALTPSTATTGIVNAASPLAIYRFTSPEEPVYLYVDTVLTSGVNVRVVNTSSGNETAVLASAVLGSRLRIDGEGADYQIEVRQSAPNSADAFTICYTAVSTGGCETGSAVSNPPAQPTAAQEQPVVIPTSDSSACVITAAASGGVNIRQSATTSSIIVGRLPNGVGVNALGISPSRDFYNIIYNGVNGWVAGSVVTASGNCATVPVTNPPPIIYPPTPTPAPTNPPPPTASGPCLLTLTQPTYVYSTTDADISYLFDQVMSGELIPVGRLANNSWWKTNYYDTWIPTNVFGVTVSVSGDCSQLPVVSAP